MDIYALHHVLLSLHGLLLHEDLISSITYEYPESLGFQPDLVWTGAFFLIMTLFVNYNIFNRSFWKSYMLESRILTTLCLLQNHTHTHAHTIVLFSQTQKKPRTHRSHTNSPGMWARKLIIIIIQDYFCHSNYILFFIILIWFILNYTLLTLSMIHH